jgi:hypothetical protein
MTPYEIEVMLWYYCRCEDHEDMSRNPPVWRPTIDQFMRDGMLVAGSDRNDMCYSITERGKAYVDHLCAVQIPICKWVQPEQWKERTEAKQ